MFSTYEEILKNIAARSGMSKTETYEEWAKDAFKQDPGNMKLLIVVAKLLTGFDAPSCTYLYIDKAMQDHDLFQAICRTNRLDGDDKDFGYIVDYKCLFKKVEKAIAVYTSELDDSAGGTDPQVMMQDRLTKCCERLEQALEALELICEPVEYPKEELNYLHYFCGNTDIPEDLNLREPQRIAFYKTVAAFVRTYVNIADELEAVGYSQDKVNTIKEKLNSYLDLRDSIRNAAGEKLDLKAYEADMRHLIDTYIEAKEPRKISPFDNMSLLGIIEHSGIQDAIDSLPKNLKNNKTAVAETIENNIRSKIIKEYFNDPAYYERMSALLDEIIAARKARAIEYEKYLEKIADCAKDVAHGHSEDMVEPLRKSAGLRAIYNSLKKYEAASAGKIAEEIPLSLGDNDPTLRLAMHIDQAVKTSKPDGWRDVPARENMLKQALYTILQNPAHVDTIFEIVKKHQEY